jgi:hypothetical protein
MSIRVNNGSHYSYHTNGSNNSSSDSSIDVGPNKQLEDSKSAYEKASRISGIDPHILAAMHMRENSGRRTMDGTENIDGSMDIGPMQISQQRWDSIVKDMSQEDKNKIFEVTGKRAEDLRMDNPDDNIIGGAMELKQWLKDSGGDMHEALTNYQSGGNPQLMAMAPTYADDILIGAEDIRAGRMYTGPGA